jgi:GT2 family glycosyltransferase
VTFAAVVVSYNRCELLRQCLAALEKQSTPLDEIIVIDNGSTDDSTSIVRSEFPNVFLFETGENLGGAGGFAWGVELAMAHGHDAAWLMDDDACPEADAFAPIAELLSTHPDEVSFVASTVTKEDSDALNEGNLPEVSAIADRQHRAWNLGGVAIDTATFVGVAVNLRFAKRTHLPMADFFIWGDDLEYTRRLSDLGLGLVLPTSRVKHPYKGMFVTPMGPRLYYLIRNLIWRNRGRRIGVLAWLGVGSNVEVILRSQLRVSPRRVTVLGTAWRGVRDGLFTRPRHEMPGDRLRSKQHVGPIPGE